MSTGLSSSSTTRPVSTHGQGPSHTVSSGSFKPVWLLIPVLISLLLGGATAWSSIHQSLWIDELHTAWSVSGAWGQVVQRAAVGNQPPVYFAWQWWLGRTFGHSEVCLRSTSLLAWLVSLALLAQLINRLASRTSKAALWFLLCLAALDRQQIFFATEARPYMLMSLVVLLGWLGLDAWLSIDHRSNTARSGSLAWTAWLVCSAMAIWLQPTAVLFVAAQFVWAARCIVSCPAVRRRSLIAGGMVGLCLLVLLVWPMRYVLEPVWQGRQAWAAFAADLSWQNVLRQLPIMVVAVPGLFAWIVAIVDCAVRRRTLRDASSRSATKHSAAASSADATSISTSIYCAIDDRRAQMYWVAWCVPLLLVILLTAWGIAPLMHARYLFAATLPMLLWTATMLSRWRDGRWVAVIAVGMVLVQAAQQSSITFWRVGRLPIVYRGEDWRGAIAHIQRSADVGLDVAQGDPRAEKATLQIYCACNLIEGARSDYLSGGLVREEYLSMPLRAIYPVARQARIVSLLNDPRGWSAVVSDPDKPSGTRWLLVRCSSAGLAKRLLLSDLRPLEQIDFGAVQLVRF